MVSEFTRQSVHSAFRLLVAKLPPVPGGRWTLEQAPGKRAWRVCIVEDANGGTCGTSNPFGQRYRNAEEFCTTVNFALDVLFVRSLDK